MSGDWADATAVLLAGGKGTRLASVRPDVPKPMIEVAGRPFVEWIIEQLAGAGVRRFVVSVGHLAEVAERHFESRRSHYESRDLHIELLREESPLGTGGATAFAWDRITPAPGLRPPVVVTNADSLVLTDLAPFIRAMQHPSSAIAGLVAVRVDDAGRFGSLEIDSRSHLVAFREKDPQATGAGWINAGVYALQPEARGAFPGDVASAPTPSSIERDVFPRLLQDGVYAHQVEAPFIDIGTPESLAGADEWLLEHLGGAALGRSNSA